MKKLLNFFLKTYLKDIKYGQAVILTPEKECLVFGNESSPKMELKINDYRFLKELILFGDVGFGDAYVKGYWETPDLGKVFEFLLKNLHYVSDISGSQKKLYPSNLFKLLNKLSYRFNKKNTLSRSVSNIRRHYDLNNAFFKLFLDETMTYSCALFSDENLELAEAQKKKYARICETAKLSNNDRVLEIGGGWGSFCFFVAENYDCKVTSVSLSKEQSDYVNQKIKNEDKTNKIDYEIRDYRKVTGLFDRIFSIEMIEAVGIEYLGTFFKKCDELLKPGGFLSLQVILCPDSRFKSMRKSVDWIQKHIFPGGALPSLSVLLESIGKTSELFLYDFKDMGQDYAKTLSLWHDRFMKNMDQVEKMGFSKEFIRMWRYYLKYCESAFASRNITVAQLTFARINQPLN